MNRRLLKTMLLIFLSILMFIPFVAAATDDQDRTYVKAYYPDLDTAHTTIKTFQPSPPEVNYDEGYIVMFVTAEDKARLAETGFTFEDYAGYDPLDGQSADEGLWTIPGYTCYQTVEETFSFAEDLAEDYPNLAQWIDVGDSWEKSNNQGGYDMNVLILTNASISGSKPKLFITTAIHAREYTTAPLSYHFAKQLVENYETDADIRWILDYHEIHLMLHANPDGRKKAENGASWRKNTNQDYCGSNSSSTGADLNRNFDFMWGQVQGGSSSNPCDETYRGESAASEPEVQAIQDYMSKIFTDYNGSSPNNGAPEDAQGLYIDIHSYSELVLWPWGYTNQSAPNSTALQTLGRKFAYFNNYSPKQSVNLYATDGTTVDYAYGELGVAAFIFELGTKFFQECSTFENTILPDNLDALFYAAKVCRAPYMLAAGPEALSLSVSGTTLTATIDDTRFKGSESNQNIEEAEYYIDTPPWEQGATPIAMSASDGSFNETNESVTADLGYEQLGYEQHIIFVRGKDASGNWGPVSAVFYEGSTPDPDTDPDPDPDTDPDPDPDTDPDPDPDTDPDDDEVENGETISGISGSQTDMLIYYIDVPENATNLTVEVSG
ncbi:MAG: M14 family zinc carboxypeptidase, partial [Desulfobacteraceae bacterium]